MHIPTPIRLKLFRQWALATLGLKRNVHLKLTEEAGVLYIHFEGKQHAIPDILRWKVYRHGWVSRTNELKAAYGVGRYFNLNRQSVVIDIGANTGDFTLGVAPLCKSVYCFEPDPKAHKCPTLNLAKSPNVEIVRKGVWKKDETISFGLETARADSSVFSQAIERVEIDGITLDSFIKEKKINRVALVKCDAEGAEPEVLQGALASASLIDGFAFDTGAERAGQCTDKECEELLRSYGYKTFTEVAGGRQMTYGLRP